MEVSWLSKWTQWCSGEIRNWRNIVNASALQFAPDGISGQVWGNALAPEGLLRGERRIFGGRSWGIIVVMFVRSRGIEHLE
jgi:hypothetical protein